MKGLMSDCLTLRSFFLLYLIELIEITGRDNFSAIIMNCEALNCERGNSCCQITNGIAYCEISSICKTDPIWEAIVIPAVIVLLAVILIIITIYKLRNFQKSTMKVSNFARQ